MEWVALSSVSTACTYASSSPLSLQSVMSIALPFHPSHSEALGFWLPLSHSFTFLGSTAISTCTGTSPFFLDMSPSNFCSTAFRHAGLKGLWGLMDFEDLTRVLGSLKVVGVSVCSSSFPGLGRRRGGLGQETGLCTELHCNGQLITPNSFSLLSTYRVLSRFGWADPASENPPKCIG